MPTLFAAPSIPLAPAPSIPLASQLRALIHGWEVSEVVLVVQTGEKEVDLANISQPFVGIKAFGSILKPKLWIMCKSMHVLANLYSGLI